MSTAEVIERAIANEKARLDAQEPPRPRAAHPMPSKDEAWRAFCNAANDAEEAPDRAAFERWWAGRE